MKRAVTLLVLILSLSACSTRPTLQGPLEDTGEHVTPPQGCIELRERGGTC